MLYLVNSNGLQAAMSLPVTLDVRTDYPGPEHMQHETADRPAQKALAAAYEKFAINKGTYEVRLSCPAGEMPWIGGYARAPEIYV